MAVERCVVAFRGESGITHLVDVEGESVFEAATRALARFQAEPWLKAELTLRTVLLVEVTERGKEFRIEVRRLLAWFDGPGKDRARRYKLKLLLERPQTSPRVNARIRAH